MAWAASPTYPQHLAPWLPEKPEGVAFSPGDYPKPSDSLYFVTLRKKFEEIKRKRWAVTDETCASIVEQSITSKALALDAYDAWAGQQRE